MIAGEQKKIDLVKTAAGFRIKLDEADIKDSGNITVLLNNPAALFDSFSLSIEKGGITEKNFSETMLGWKKEFDRITGSN